MKFYITIHDTLRQQRPYINTLTTRIMGRRQGLVADNPKAVVAANGLGDLGGCDWISGDDADTSLAPRRGPSVAWK